MFTTMIMGQSIMIPDHLIVPCKKCGAKNRVPSNRSKDKPICGRCHSPLSLSDAYPSHPVDVTDKTFRDEVLNFPGSVVAFFWASWCTYCRTLMPVITELSKKYAGKIKFARIQTDHNQAMSDQYDVLSLPTLILFKNGRQVNRVTGSVPRAQLEYQLAPLL